MTQGIESDGRRGTRAVDEWVRRGCTLVVAAVAAYSSYEHQREFALRGGADAISATLWPLSVDGLLVLATVGLLKAGRNGSPRVRVAVWSSFLLGIAVSLAANIAAAPTLAWQPILVAGWPPVALLLAVELLGHRANRRDLVETEQAVPGASQDSETDPAVLLASRDSETVGGSGVVTGRSEVSQIDPSSAEQPTAQEIMWEHVLRVQADGRVPTGAELDRVAGTNNYGSRVLRQWREEGRLQPAGQNGRSSELPPTSPFTSDSFALPKKSDGGRSQ